MLSQTHLRDDGVPRGLPVDAYAPEVPGAHAPSGMPPSAWTQELTDVAGAGGDPASSRAHSAVVPPAATEVEPVGADAGVGLPPVGGAPVGQPSDALARASNEQLLQAAVRATREAAQAAADLRRSLEQHKRRAAS